MSIQSPESLLVFSPHPDDAAIGCGGTIAKLNKVGTSITIAYVTDGEMGSESTKPDKIVPIRREEARNAAKTLGADKTHFFGSPDGGVCFNRETLRSFIKLIREEAPDVICFPHTTEADRDHTVVSELCLAALRKVYAPTFPEDGKPPQDSLCQALAYEVWTPITDPTTFKSISSVRERKIQAIRCHESQTGSIKYDEAAISLNRYRGVMSGTGGYAEAFEIIQQAHSE